jgi:hypothetical protein
MDSMKIVRLKNSSRYQSVARKPVPGGKVGHASPTVSHVRHCAALPRRIFYPHHGHVLSWLVLCSALSCYGDVTIAGDLTHARNPDPGAWHGVCWFLSIVHFFFAFSQSLQPCVVSCQEDLKHLVLPQPVFENSTGSKNSEVSESVAFYKIWKNSAKFRKV